MFSLIDVVRLIAELDEEITQGFEINWIHYDDLCALRERLSVSNTLTREQA